MLSTIRTSVQVVRATAGPVCRYLPFGQLPAAACARSWPAETGGPVWNAGPEVAKGPPKGLPVSDWSWQPRQSGLRRACIHARGEWTKAEREIAGIIRSIRFSQ
jgi:hypothetical protein